MRLLPLATALFLCVSFAAHAQVLPVSPPASPVVAPAESADKPAPPPAPDTTVNLVQVDATGKDAADAKKTAVAQGAQDAFHQLIKKLYPDNAQTILAKIKPEEITGFLDSQQVENEKPEGLHYQGVLDYHFNPKKIAALAPAVKSTSGDGAESNVNAHSVLLLPVLKFNDNTELWEDENSWRKSWNHVALQVGRGQIIVPYGDRRDREEIGADEALGGGFKEFASIADRYGVKEVYVAIAEYQSSDLSEGVQVQLRRISATGVTTETVKYDAEERETREQQLERVALAFARKLTQIKGAATQTYQGLRDSELTLQITHDGFKDFQKICTMLQEIPSVRHLHVNMTSYYESTVTLVYRTSPELLGKSFAAKGFRIYKKGDTLILALRG